MEGLEALIGELEARRDALVEASVCGERAELAAAEKLWKASGAYVGLANEAKWFPGRLADVKKQSTSRLAGVNGAINSARVLKRSVEAHIEHMGASGEYDRVKRLLDEAQVPCPSPAEVFDALVKEF